MDKTKLSYIGVAVNVLLLGLKLWAGIVSGSIAAISDALNSLLDVFSYAILSYAVYLQDQEPDERYPYGHRRAEPLAGMIVAVLAAILGGTIVKDAVVAFFSRETTHVTTGVLVVLGLAVVIKIVQSTLYYSVGRSTGSRALLAGAVDSRNDVLASSVVIFGVYVGGYWEGVAAVAIGLWILYSGIRIGLENVDYLMGRGADEKTVARIREAALSIDGVEGIDEIRAHFVGDRIHADVHIEVNGDMSLIKAHDVSTLVKEAVDALPGVDNAFVHVDVLEERPDVKEKV